MSWSRPRRLALVSDGDDYFGLTGPHAEFSSIAPRSNADRVVAAQYRVVLRDTHERCLSPLGGSSGAGFPRPAAAALGSAAYQYGVGHIHHGLIGVAEKPVDQTKPSDRSRLRHP